MTIIQKKTKYAGMALSYQLYRIAKWLWNLEIRMSFNKIVDYVYQLSGTIEDEGSQVKIAMDTIFGRKLDEEQFKYVLKRLKDLERIKENDIEILTQLRAFGDKIKNFKELNGFLFVAHRRLSYGGGEMKGMAANFVLAIPSISRVVSYQTLEDIQTFKQFFNMQITNTQFYSMFNKLKALRGRSTKYISEMSSLDDISFLFRRIEDLKIIHKSPKIHLFTFTPTTGEESKKFQVANYFMILGKISKFKTSEISGKKIASVQDDSGTINMMIGDREIIHAHKSSIKKVVQEYFEHDRSTSKEISLSYSGYGLIFGYWSMDVEHPWIYHLIPLGNSVSNKKIEKFNLISYLNIRKKINITALTKLFPLCKELPKEVLLAGKWAYLVKNNWDLDIFSKSRKLEKTKFTKLLEELLGVNDIFVPLYQSENPEKDFAEFYRLHKEKTCPECGRELFELSTSSIKSHIQNNNGRISAEYQSLFSFQEGILETLESIKSSLHEITSSGNKEKATKFVSKFFEEKKDFFENTEELEICKTLHEIFGCINDLKQRRMYFEFSKNNEIISMFLKLENPINIHVGSSEVLKLSMGKNCVEHGPIGLKVLKVRGKISYILEKYAKEEIDKKQAEVFSSLSLKIKSFCTRWYNLVENSIENNTVIPEQEIIKIKKHWSDFRNEVNNDMFSNIDGIKIELSQMKQIAVNDTSFFILCYLVKKLELYSIHDWKNLTDRISEFSRRLKSESTKQTSNIGDMNILLRTIALEFYNFHYREVTGTKDPFGVNVLYDMMSQHMERCTYVSPKYRGEKFHNLRSVSFHTYKFREMAKMLLTGEISGLQSAEVFLRSNRYSRTKSKAHYKSGQQGKSYVRQIQDEARSLMAQSAPRKIEYADSRKTTTKKEKRHIVPNFESRFDRIGFERSLEELIMVWNRAMDAKKMTHAPHLYQKMETTLSSDIQMFVNHFSKICPELKRLRRKSPKSKEVKKFFNMVSGKRDLSKEIVSKLMRQI